MRRTFLVAYLGLLGWGVGLYRWQVQHPSHWPVTLLILGMAVAVGAQTLGVIRSFRSRDRRARWTMLSAWLGMLALLFAQWWMISYVLDVTSTRQIPDNLAVRWCASIGSALGDLEKCLRYRHRYVGQRVEMYSDRPISNAWSLVSLADAHLASIENELGSPMPVRVHWIRGTLLGRNNYQFLGLAMSNLDIEEGSGAVRFTNLDRHELAHFAIHGRSTAEPMPPFVLVEGWAQAKSGMSREKLVRDAWQARYELSMTWQLDRLIEPSFYERDDGPVYSIGGALVEHLLRRYGPHKFRDLYLNARQPTFASQFEKAYGKTLAEVETQLWQEIEDLMRDSPLRPLWIDPNRPPAKIDPSLWREIAENANRASPLDSLAIINQSWQLRWTQSKNGKEIERGVMRLAWNADQRWRHRVIEYGPSTVFMPREELIGQTNADGRCVVLERESVDAPWKPARNFSTDAEVREYVQHSWRTELDSARSAVHPGYTLAETNRELYELTEAIDRKDESGRRVELHLLYMQSDNPRRMVLTLAPEWQWRTVMLSTSKDGHTEPDQKTILEWQWHGDDVRVKRRWSENEDEEGAKCVYEANLEYRTSDDGPQVWSMDRLPRHEFRSNRKSSWLERVFAGLAAVAGLGSIACCMAARR